MEYLAISASQQKGVHGASIQDVSVRSRRDHLNVSNLARKHDVSHNDVLLYL